MLKGEISQRDYHAISGPEMLQMALIGFRMYEQGKYSEAKTIFQGLIALDPMEAYYYTALGAVYLAEEDLENARAMFSSSINDMSAACACPPPRLRALAARRCSRP